MKTVAIDGTFANWRKVARALVNLKIMPEEVNWQLRDLSTEISYPQKSQIFVPREFVSLAEKAGLFRSEDRWDLLYRLLWRLQFEDKTLMLNLTDDDIIKLQRRAKAVHRDTHKMKAFVRFKQVDENTYIAWHNPDHFVVRLAAPFFVERFAIMKWSILTPDESMHWDGKKLIYSAGVEIDPCLKDDFETYWLTYYAHIFNPARIKIKAMKNEMPVRHWKTLPETKIIESMLQKAPQRVEEMLSWQPPSPEKFIQEHTTVNSTLEDLKTLAKSCTFCPLHKNATQTVFGEGPKDAKIVFVGEQPGDQEDLAGLPFVGPAGQLLDRALEILGINRQQIYITNAVKHFKWTPGEGRKRIHQNPESREIAVCKSWLDHELELIKPEIIVCLGATAAQAILGKVVKIKDVRGSLIQLKNNAKILVTTHPSAILRARENQEKAFADFLKDLECLKIF